MYPNDIIYLVFVYNTHLLYIWFFKLELILLVVY